MGFLDFFKSTPSPERFATIAVEGLRAAGYSAPIAIDQPNFRLLLGADGKATFNLDNFYRDYCRVSKGERKGVVADYSKGMIGNELPAAFADAKSKLLPIVRSKSMIEYISLSSSDDPGSSDLPASLPFSADAAVMLAYDTEHSLITLTEGSLADWGVSLDSALAVATDNLRDLTVANFEEVVPGLFVSAWNDSYDTSRLLFPDLMYQLGLAGEPVVMIPTRNRLMVVSANDRGGQMAMLGVARQFVQEEGRQISSLMYRYEQGKPVEYVPTDPEVAALLAASLRQQLGEEYSGQKEMLEKSHAKAGVDVFVASYQVLSSNETGNEASFTVWTEDVDTLLPETDLVALVSTADLEDESAAPPKLVAWQALQTSTGPFERVPDRYPPRYRPVNFPDRATRDALPATEL